MLPRAAVDAFKSSCRDGNLQEVSAWLAEHQHAWPPELEKVKAEGLSGAVWASRRSVVAYLLSNGAKLNESAFVGCVSHKDREIFQEFLDHGFKINSTEFDDPAIRSGPPT